MYLNKLQIIGFKSFADKIEVEFDSGVTAIVGPNGCGKTNIVDAVRWAIGEQKASVLRSSTMENVIFNGTKNRRALGYAEVSLTVENTKGILPSEYTEIKITRRCFRDGQSNYLLNGTPCRLKDITSLFMDTGMGSDAYSVIELKMVNDILSHRTQDRRKLFEEAAGITKYKERRREALYKLETARESLSEANIEIRNRQRTVNAYEKIAQKQQEAKEISVKLKEIEIDYHQRLYSKLIEDTKQIESLMNEKEAEREEIQKKQTENEEVIDTFKSELAVTERELNLTRENLNSVTSGITKNENAISLAEQRIKSLNENITRYNSEREVIEREIEKYKRSGTENEEKINVVNDTIKLMEQSLKDKKTALEEMEVKVKQSRDELKDLTAKHAAVSRSLTERRNEYEVTKTKLESQLGRCSRLTDENIENINKVAVFDNELNEAESGYTTTKDVLQKLTIEYDNLKNIKDEYEAELGRLEKEIINKSHEIALLKDKVQFQINLLENYDDYSEGIRYLVKELKEKDVKVVIDKLEVEDKFKAAIETALGEISSYLIVDNEDAAGRYIRLLKDNQKGKITFILKDNLYKSTLNIFQDEFPEILKHEGVYGWADKFIKCPDEYLLLYKYLLDEYIIVENFDTASRLSQGNFIKFITLDGDIVTNSFMRAGARTNVETLKIGRENLIESFKEQIKNLDNTIKEDKKQLESINARYFEINTEEIFSKLQELKTVLIEEEGKISKVTYLKNQTNALIDNSNSEIAELNGSNKLTTARIDSLIVEIDKSENEKYQHERELEHFTTELENLADELTRKGEEYNNFNIEVTKIKGELTNLQNEISRTDENINSREQQIEQRANECILYKNEIKELNEKIGDPEKQTGLAYEISQQREKENEVREQFDNIKNKYDDRKSFLDKLDHEQKKIYSTRDSIISFIHDNELKLTEDRIEIRKHKERISEEYNEEIVYTDYTDKNSYNYDAKKTELERYKLKLRQLGGTGQMELALYEQEKRDLEKMIEEKNDLVKAEGDLIELIEHINKTAQEKFKETFEKIRSNFRNIFRELFMEGDEADLRLVLEEENQDPLDAKIDIIAKPRGKRPQLIDLLSGGEKTLTAIALLFAIYQVKPSPFCILDEVDAPLDDANIDRFIKIVRKFSVDTQFIIVTHNKRTMEAADSMYGVTMAEEGISTIVNVKFHDQMAAVS